MMLVLVFRDNYEHIWHIREKLRLNDRQVLDVQVVQADGDELQYIIDYMPNVPYANTRPVNRWYGDMAKFIAGNL